MAYTAEARGRGKGCYDARLRAQPRPLMIGQRVIYLSEVPEAKPGRHAVGGAQCCRGRHREVSGLVSCCLRRRNLTLSIQWYCWLVDTPER